MELDEPNVPLTIAALWLFWSEGDSPHRVEPSFTQSPD
jgi:hypothetical protein